MDLCSRPDAGPRLLDPLNVSSPFNVVLLPDVAWVERDCVCSMRNDAEESVATEDVASRESLDRWRRSFLGGLGTYDFTWT